MKNMLCNQLKCKFADSPLLAPECSGGELSVGNSRGLRRGLAFVFRCLLVVFLFAMVVASANAAEKVTYEDHVRPILREHCFACHNQDDAESGLSLDSFEGLTTGGAGGEIVSAGNLDGSRIWKLITHEEEPNMPPDNKMPEDQLKVVRLWIEGGLLKDSGSKPMKINKPTIAKIDPSMLGKPAGKPAMPEQMFHEPLLWTSSPGPVDALATSSWAPLAAIGWQRQVSFYHTETHELLGIIPYVDGVPRVVRFSRDGSLVLVAGGRHSAAGSASLFDVKTGARLVTIGDELDIVLAADISVDLSLVAIGGPKKKVRVFRVADGSLVYTLGKHTDWVTAVGFSPDGKLLATADRSGSALLWNAVTGTERADLRGHKATISSLDWRADSALAATASEDGTVRLWDPQGKQTKSITAHKSGVLSVRFSKAGDLVTAGRDKQIKTWKPNGSLNADLGKFPGITLAATFTHDGGKVLASDYTGEVRLIDVASKKTLTTFQANPQRLSLRLANAEKTWQKNQQAIQNSEAQLNKNLTALEQGKAAHTVHEKKMAAAQATLVTQQEQYDELAQLHTDHEQKLAAARAIQQATAKLAEAQQALAAVQIKQAEEKAASEAASEESQTEESSTKTADAEQLAKLQESITAAQTALAAANEKVKQAEQAHQESAQKHQAAEKSVEVATATLAQVSNETAGLPDLAKLAEQHTQFQTQLATAKQQLQSAEQTKAQLTAQQTRFAQATAQFTEQLSKRQAAQQVADKETGELEANHRRAAEKLAAHRKQLSEVTKQLQALQATLTELNTNDAKLLQQEQELATQLSKVQITVGGLQQQRALLETRQKDFAAAAKLREVYAK